MYETWLIVAITYHTVNSGIQRESSYKLRERGENLA